MTKQVQETRCLEYVAEQGWSIDPETDVYDDTGSASKRGVRRPRFELLLRRAQEGRYNRVVSWRFDRASRDYGAWGRIFTDLPDEFEWHSAEEGLNTGKDGMAVQIITAVAGNESLVNRKRVKASKELRAKQGHFLGSVRPFGWEPVLVTDEFDTTGSRRSLRLCRVKEAVKGGVDNEADALKHVIEMVLAGSSITAAARWLSDSGWSTTPRTPGAEDGPGAKRAWWSVATLMRLLRSPVLVGCRGNKGQAIEKDDNGDLRQIFEPLIDWTTWLRLSERLERQSRTRLGTIQTSLLAGLVRCGVCGYSMGSGGPSSGHSSVYRCKSRSDRGPEVCPGCSVSRPRLDSHISVLALLLLVGTPAPRAPDPVEEALARLQVKAQMLVANAGDYAGSPALEQAYRQQLEAIRREEETLNRKARRRMPSELPDNLSSSLDLRELVEAGLDPDRATAGTEYLGQWASVGLAEKRELIASVIETVFVGKGDRAATARLPNDARGDIRARLSVVVASEPEITLDYNEALAMAAGWALVRLRDS